MRFYWFKGGKSLLFGKLVPFWSHSGPILVPFWLGMIRHLQQLFQSRSGCCSACIFPSKKTLSICCETLQTSLCYRAATYRDSSGSVSAPKHPNFIVWEGKWRQTVGNKVVKFVFCSPPLPSFTKLHFLSPPVQLGAVGGHSDRHKGELFLFSWGSDSHKPTPKNKTTTTTKKPREKENKQKPQDKLLRLNLWRGNVSASSSPDALRTWRGPWPHCEEKPRPSCVTHQWEETWFTSLQCVHQYSHPRNFFTFSHLVWREIWSKTIAKSAKCEEFCRFFFTFLENKQNDNKIGLPLLFTDQFGIFCTAGYRGQRQKTTKKGTKFLFLVF